MPLVSVIITSYNYARFLPRAVDSALAQTHPSLEVIVVDDGSTDQSLALLHRYGEAITLLTQANRGQNSAANRGFACSRGDYVLFLDADDYLLDSAVTTLLQPLLTAPLATRSQGYLQLVDAAGGPLPGRRPRRLPASGDHRQATILNGPSAIPHSNTSGNLWPRWFLDRVMPLPEHRMPVGVDSCLNPVATLLGPIVCVPTIVAAYRVHGANAGPVSTAFDAASLRSRLLLADATQAELAGWLETLAIPLPSDTTRSWQTHWQRLLLRYAIDHLEGHSHRWRGRDFMLSGQHFRSVRRLRAGYLWFAIAMLGLLPDAARFRVIRRLLAAPVNAPADAQPGVASAR